MLRLTLRNLMARKVRLVMSTLAIVLGVAFLAGVLTFSNGLNSTFDNIVEGSTSDGLVRAKDSESFSGGQTGISTATLTPADVRRIAAVPEVEAADGSVDGLGMSLLDSDGKLVGGQGAPTLAFNNTPTKNLAGEDILLLESGRWPTKPGEVALDVRSADVGDYQVGDEVSYIAPSGRLVQQAKLVGTANFNGGGTAGATLVIFSTAGAQQVFLDGRDVFTSVSLTAAQGVSRTRMVDAVRKVLPEQYTAVTGDTVVKESQDSISQFTSIINTFLLVFAGIAVLVGGFIIINTFSILIAQRTRDLALLRALGANRRQVVRSVMVEAVVMSLIACTVGVLIGWGLAIGLAALFRLFGLDIAGGALTLTPATVITSFIVGVGLTLAAAYFPARRAGRIPPVAAMREDAIARPGSLRRRALIGAVVGLVGAGIAATGAVGGAPGNDAAWIGVGAAICLVTLAVLTAVVGRPVLVVCRGLFRSLFGTAGQLAGENALRDPRRTGATASALMIGLALVSTIGVLAASFGKAVDDQVDEVFTSDFLIAGPNFAPFSPEIAKQVREVDGVGLVAASQTAGARVDGRTEYLSATDPDFAKIYQPVMTSGSFRTTGDDVAVAEGAAKELGLSVGDTVETTFLGGSKQRLTVSGIFEGVPNLGDMVVDRTVLADAGIRPQDNAISIDVAPGADAAEVKQRLDDVVADLPIVSVQDKQEFADGFRAQITQLLNLIYGLLALAIVIAVIGIVNTLGLSVIERTREIGLLRAIGLSRRTLRRIITLESVAIALLGAVLGMAFGVITGALLRYALRDDLTALGLPLGSLVVFLVITVVVGVLAAIIPAIRAARMNVLSAIYTE